MPSAISSHALSPTRTDITKFTNCRVFRDGALRREDLWISSRTGKVLHSQGRDKNSLKMESQKLNRSILDVFYSNKVVPDNVIDLGDRILSPGLIEAQLNGAFGFDFSVVPKNISQYPKGLLRINKSLIKTGVTSYTPTTTCQKPEVYHQVFRDFQRLTACF
jgi:N-acetylglucosamine-6-phosphate deacetylase